MKYILLMSGTKAGVDSYHAWSQKDIETHMAVLRSITNDLSGSGEFVATQGLAEPAEPKVVRGEKNEIHLDDEHDASRPGRPPVGPERPPGAHRIYDRSQQRASPIRRVGLS